nr:hypothetical protein [Bradyrhizobium sp. CCH1-B1]
MPRRLPIYAAQTDLRRWQINVDAICQSSRGERREHFGRIAKRLQLTDDALIALVKITTRLQRRQGPRAYGPQRNALVIFPYDDGVNLTFKSAFGSKCSFDGEALGWMLPIDTDGAATRMMARLLNIFDLLVVEDGPRSAFVYW